MLSHTFVAELVKFALIYFVLMLQVPLKVAPALDPNKLEGLKLRLSGDHQLINAGLAASLCKCWLERTGNWEKLFKNVG